MRRTGIVAFLYIAAIAISITAFAILVHVMDTPDKTWDLQRLILVSETLSGTNSNLKTDSSFKNAVNHEEAARNVLQNETAAKSGRGERPVRKSCEISKPSIRYPFCRDKVEYVRAHWKDRCYAEENNIRDTDSCSVLIYLSEIENWCSPLPWRKTTSTLQETQAMMGQKTKIRDTVDDLIARWFSDDDYKWMQNRIKSMEEDWRAAITSLSKKRALTQRSKKKILVFLGAFAWTPFLLQNAFSGGPLGELVQWSDVITSLHLLGHELTVVKREKDLRRYVPLPDKNGCINKDTVQQLKYDLIFTDINGVVLTRQLIGPYWSQLRCKVRILDSFGTEAEFNFGKLGQTNKKLRSGWGGLDLNLRQFMTMFPHSPDNSFIGFVSGSKEIIERRDFSHLKKNKALVYGKLDFYWEFGNRKYLDQIHKYVEIHGTFTATLKKRPDYIPDYVINHGVVNGTTIQRMLKESKVFVGLGFPYEGPAPLEATANGAAFLNPKFSTPLNRYNSGFFQDKPTRRLVTSQNPYAENFIGEPYVYTIDINNLTEVQKVMGKIMKNRLRPYIPYEFTHEGTLERISAQVEHLDFCSDSRWPPLKNMVTVKSPPGQSCQNACWAKGLVCEPSYWNIVNQLISFRREGIICGDTKYDEMTSAPSFQEDTKTCYFQEQPMLYSCVSSRPSHIRLCPCRDFIKGQVALCKGCW